ncbi:hypothetical protein AZE42_12006 [Rhizopogon vesiculosus]|uniref:Uncharacterized protein n=1 Tax=Rhizopogon vesiculosus TaxID=180088 RepID=A0A1J8Q5M4_9AGAM|nr:hypothetical protein AZE42_12006 [Rhizopogon vesiculosus]
MLALPNADSDVRKLQPPAEEPVAGEQAALLTPPVAAPEDMSTGTIDQKSTSEEESCLERLRGRRVAFMNSCSSRGVARRPPRPSVN